MYVCLTCIDAMPAQVDARLALVAARPPSADPCKGFLSPAGGSLSRHLLSRSNPASKEDQA